MENVDSDKLEQALELLRQVDALLQEADPDGECSESQSGMKDAIEGLEADSIRALD